MHRGKYKEFDITEGVIIDLNTNKEIGQHLDLYCYTADENNIYYDTPHIDYPDHYVVEINGERINVAQIMAERGEFNYPYIIVSRHKKLTSIESFHIDECNSFYSVPILPEVANFVNDLGLDKFYVKENLWEFNLNNIKSNQDLSGKELLFFIDSEDSDIRIMLNELRLEYLLANLHNKKNSLIDKGVPIISNDKFQPFTYTKIDKYHIKKASSSTEQIISLINNRRLIQVSPYLLKLNADRAANNERNVIVYCNTLEKYYRNLFNADAKLIDIESKSDCCLFFGFITNQMILDMEEELKNEISM